LQTALEIKELYYRDYVSADGLGLLKAKDGENANGILFLAMMLAKFVKAKVFDQVDINNAHKACLATEVEIGLPKRVRSNWEVDAHDNLVGRAGLSLICEFDEARKLADRGNRYGWSYNSMHPEQQELRTTIQGGTVCFIKMMAGYIPYPTEYLWMLGGILVAAFKGTPSTVNLNWFSIECLDLCFEKKFSKTHWTHLLYPLVKFIFKLKIKQRFGGIKGSYNKYFLPEHPMHLILEHINENHID
jgi:hypothetical protein